MSNDYNDDFVEDDDFYGDEETASAGSSSGPFLIALAVLIGVFIISALCISTMVISKRASNGQNDAVAAIETQNAVIQETNIAVTVAIQSTETARAEEAAIQPTFTSEANTPTPETEPTETPVVERATADAESGNGDGSEGEEGQEIAGGENGEGSEGDENSEGGEESNETSGNGAIVIGATATPSPTPISSTDGSSGKDSTLPDTGLEVWGIALMGLLLIAVLIGARKLRTN